MWLRDAPDPSTMLAHNAAWSYTRFGVVASLTSVTFVHSIFLQFDILSDKKKYITDIELANVHLNLSLLDISYTREFLNYAKTIIFCLIGI